MQFRVVVSGESQTAGRQQYITRSRRMNGMSGLAVVVPGACTCCEGCSSCSSAW